MMTRKAWQISLSIGVMGCILGMPAQAETRFPQPRKFTVEQPCEAYGSLKKQTNASALRVGSAYIAYAENKQANATHALIDVDNQNTNKWVALSCGHYADTPNNANAVPIPAPDARSKPANQCLPFFDNENNIVKLKAGQPADITPPLPSLNAFDKAVNQVCGKAGKTVTANEFRDLLRAHPDALKHIQSFTAGKVFADRPAASSTDAYLNELTEAWFNVQAFNHIFCGEPKANGPVDGLHFIGRYVQLQESGEACRMDNYRQNEVVPGVLYSMGMSVHLPNGGTARSSIKGYGLTLNAEDILKSATKAFSENPTASQSSTACLLPTTDDGKSFTSVFVRRYNGIRTFYPDATPDTRKNPACQAAVSL
jgi:hypothetical protein